MKKNIFEVNEEEKKRIIEMHINATNKIYLPSKKDDDNLIKKTLSFLVENNKTLLKEGDEKWKTTYSCVPKHPNAKKVTLGDGSTAYTIWGVTYYNSGRRATSKNTNTNYSCNDIMFKYPTNQAESDKFRNWMFKNYDAKSLKSSYDLEPKGPWNSVAVLKAWSLNGTTYLDKKGRENPSTYIPNVTYDAKCNNVPNMEYNNYYKKCYLSKERQKTLFAGEKGFEVNWFPVKDENEWYQMYALLKAEKIETLIAEMWGFYGGACKGGESAVGLNFPQTKDGKKYNLMDAIKWNISKTTPGQKTPSTDMFRICYNDNIVTQKPYSNRGKYTGYKPTYTDVINAYGPITVQEYGKKIYQAEGALMNEDSQGNPKLNIKGTTGLEPLGDLAKKVGKFIDGSYIEMDVDILVNLISLCFDYAGLTEVSMFIDAIHGFSYFYRAYYLEFGSVEWMSDVLLGCLEITFMFFPAIGNIQMITVTKFIEELVKRGIAKEARNLVIFLYKIIKHYNGSSAPTSTGKVIANVINEIIELRKFILEHPYNFPAILLESIDTILDIIGGSLNFSDSDWEEIDRVIMQTDDQENRMKFSPNVKIAPDKLSIDIDKSKT